MRTKQPLLNPWVENGKADDNFIVTTCTAVPGVPADLFAVIYREQSGKFLQVGEGQPPACLSFFYSLLIKISDEKRKAGVFRGLRLSDFPLSYLFKSNTVGPSPLFSSDNSLLLPEPPFLAQKRKVGGWTGMIFFHSGKIFLKHRLMGHNIFTPPLLIDFDPIGTLSPQPVGSFFRITGVWETIFLRLGVFAAPPALALIKIVPTGHFFLSCLPPAPGSFQLSPQHIGSRFYHFPFITLNTPGFLQVGDSRHADFRVSKQPGPVSKRWNPPGISLLENTITGWASSCLTSRPVPALIKKISNGTGQPSHVQRLPGIAIVDTNQTHSVNNVENGPVSIVFFIHKVLLWNPASSFSSVLAGPVKTILIRMIPLPTERKNMSIFGRRDQNGGPAFLSIRVN